MANLDFRFGFSLLSCLSNVLGVGVTTSPHKIRNRFPASINSSPENVRINLR
jgi:hypothetical protein